MLRGKIKEDARLLLDGFQPGNYLSVKSSDEEIKLWWKRIKAGIGKVKQGGIHCSVFERHFKTILQLSEVLNKFIKNSEMKQICLYFNNKL